MDGWDGWMVDIFGAIGHIFQSPILGWCVCVRLYRRKGKARATARASASDGITYNNTLIPFYT